jgi:hypothetical protein
VNHTTTRSLGLILVATLSLLPISRPAVGWAGHESFAVYEDWTSADSPRGDRWSPGSDPGHELERRQGDQTLFMRFRREGETGGDIGATGFLSNRMAVSQPLSVDQIEADVRVLRVRVTGCPANPAPSIARVAVVDLIRFSDLNPAVARPPGSLVGDHIARLRAVRTSTSAQPAGVLDIEATLIRCNDATCAGSTTIAGPVTLGQVRTGRLFRLRLIWDSPANRFLVGLDRQADQALQYAAAANQRPANVPLGTVRIQHQVARCTVASGGPAVADAELEVRRVRTNASAVIP